MRRTLPLLLLGAAAVAHDVAHPRTAALRLSPLGISLRVDHEIAAGAAARALRQAFDRNHDGLLDPGEQEALVEHLARTALLRTRLLVDGAELELRRAAVRGEKIDQPASSTALLAVRIELRASWPSGSGDWLGRRRVSLKDEDPSGHVPVAVSCEKCRISDASSGVWEKAAGEERVLGANTPLEVVARF
jgi:hypothetical protein